MRKLVQRAAGRLLRRRVDHLGQLLRRLPKHSDGAEIGVWEGDLSDRLLRDLRPHCLHLIDPWRFALDPRYEGAWYGGSKAQSQEEMDRIYTGVLARFESQIDDGIVAVHRKISAEAAAEVTDASLDWAFVDGDHLYEAVREDVRLYWSKIKPGGFLCGDDHVIGGWWGDGVIRAVNEFAEAERVAVTLFGRYWLIRRPSDQQARAV